MVAGGVATRGMAQPGTRVDVGKSPASCEDGELVVAAAAGRGDAVIDIDLEAGLKAEG